MSTGRRPSCPRTASAYTCVQCQGRSASILPPLAAWMFMAREATHSTSPATTATVSVCLAWTWRATLSTLHVRSEARSLWKSLQVCQSFVLCHCPMLISTCFSQRCRLPSVRRRYAAQQCRPALPGTSFRLRQLSRAATALPGTSSYLLPSSQVCSPDQPRAPGLFTRSCHRAYTNACVLLQRRCQGFCRRENARSASSLCQPSESY